jgi:hypothetical protein
MRCIVFKPIKSKNIVKNRIIKEGNKYKIQKKILFWWKTYKDEECDLLGFMYAPHGITYDSLEEARAGISLVKSLEI